MMKRLFFSAGEPSGDLHAAELIAAIRKKHPDWECVGLGGPVMAKAGCKLHADLTELAIMWLGRALINLHKFYRLATDAENFFRNNKVDAVVLVDYPGFNWHIAKRAKKYGIPVFYFMPPQIWSWASWRVKKMKKYVDHVLCCLPFEEKWFRAHGCNVHWVGHPFFEEVRHRQLDGEFLDGLRPFEEKGPLLTLLPGSRTQEVHNNFRDFLEIVRVIRREVPNVQPVVAAFKESQRQWIEKFLTAQGEPAIPVYVGKTPELIHAATCCLAVSGSVSLELLANRKPSVIYYRIGYLPYFAQRWFRRSRFITLVNILACDTNENGEGAEEGKSFDHESHEIPHEKHKKSSTSVIFREDVRAFRGKTTTATDSLDRIFYPKTMRLIPVRPLPEDHGKMLFPEFLTWKTEAQEAATPLIEWLQHPDRLQTRETELAALLNREYQGESPIQNTLNVLEKVLSE